MAIEQEKLVRLEALALEWVNRNFDISPPLLELPQGERYECTKCPIAVALNEHCDGRWSVDYHNVEGWQWNVNYGYDMDDTPITTIPVPHEIKLFQQAFDEGYYPELIEKGD